MVYDAVAPLPPLISQYAPTEGEELSRCQKVTRSDLHLPKDIFRLQKLARSGLRMISFARSLWEVPSVRARRQALPLSVDSDAQAALGLSNDTNHAKSQAEYWDNLPADAKLPRGFEIKRKSARGNNKCISKSKQQPNCSQTSPSLLTDNSLNTFLQLVNFSQ